ncbi:hypothetical protein ACFL20_12535 [Spirochaetota bacterium]
MFKLMFRAAMILLAVWVQMMIGFWPALIIGLIILFIVLSTGGDDGNNENGD